MTNARSSSKPTTRSKSASSPDKARQNDKGRPIVKSASALRGESSHAGQFLSRGFTAVVSPPSRASETARKVERTFARGVGSSLRKAQASGVAVTIQHSDGRLVSGVVRERSGAFSIRDEARSSTKKNTKSTSGRESGRKR